MNTLKYANEKQKKAVAESMKSYEKRSKMETKTQFLTVGNVFEEPALIIVNQGDLGVGFIDPEGKTSWLNSVGEHALLQFLIDKQYHKNIVKNSKRILK